MISLAGRDILHSLGKFVFTGMGLGLLIGVTLSMAGIYRGLVDDGKALLDNSGADLWVVQQDTLGPYAESSSIYDDAWRGVRSMSGVAKRRPLAALRVRARPGSPRSSESSCNSSPSVVRPSGSKRPSSWRVPSDCT